MSCKFVLHKKNIFLAFLSESAYLRTLRMNSCDEHLFDAVRAGRVLDVCAAIASGAIVNATDSLKQRPLNVAAAFAHRFDCMIELLLHGADVNACDSTTRMPLHVAVITGSPSAIVALLNAGAAVNAVTKHDDHGITPLEYICYRDVDDVHTAAIVQALVAAGADVNRGASRPWRGTVNTVFVTPLVSSIAMGSEKAVMALMDANANMPSDTDFACLMQYNVVAELARKVQAEKAWRTSARCTWITACLALWC